MSKPCILSRCVLFGLAFALPPCIATADTSANPLPQVTIDIPMGGHSFGPTSPAWEASAKKAATKGKGDHWYTLRLNYASPKLLLSELDQAFVPNVGAVLLQPGETLHCPFRIDGLSAILPGPYDKTLLLHATPDAFNMMRDIVTCLDSPVAPFPVPRAKSSRSGKTGAFPAASCGNTPGHEPKSEGTRLYRLPLAYTTVEAVLKQLHQAYVPDNGALAVKPGEVVRSSFALDGVRIAFPNRPDNSFLVAATPEGFQSMKELLDVLDVPGAGVPGAKPPKYGFPSGYGLRTPEQIAP